MKFIRTKAVIIVFSASVAISLSAIFFAGPLVKIILTAQLEAMNGAEVNIEKVSLGLSPLAITIDKIEFTDSEMPSTNLAEIKQLDMKIRTDSLLKSRFVVSNMSLEGLQFNTSRKTPGEVFAEAEKSEPEAEKTEELSLSSIDLPDSDELINKVDLQTGKVFDELEVKLDNTKQSWKAVDDYINDKAKWDVFKKRYKKIKADYKKGNTIERLKAIKALKVLNKDIKKELNTFTKHRRQLKADYSELQKAYKAAKQAPDKDIEKLKNSFSFDEQGLGNVSRMLFGDSIGEYIELANKYYKKISPYLESDTDEENVVDRDKGKIVHFKDYRPEPEFLIEKATLSAQLTSGEFDGVARDIAFDQSVQNKPAVISLSGKNLKHSDAEKVSLKLDARNRKNTIVQFNYDISKRKLNDFEISKSKTLPLKMDSGLLDLKSEIKLINKKLTGAADAEFVKTKFTSDQDKKSRTMASMLSGAFENINAFNINAAASGKITSPRLKIKSDLDKRLNKQIKAQFSKIKKEYEKELREKLKKRYSAQISKVDNLMKEIEDKKKALESKQDELSKQLGKYKK